MIISLVFLAHAKARNPDLAGGLMRAWALQHGRGQPAHEWICLA
jgi:hypothetical protein